MKFDESILSEKYPYTLSRSDIVEYSMAKCAEFSSELGPPLMSLDDIKKILEITLPDSVTINNLKELQNFMFDIMGKTTLLRDQLRG